MPGIEEWLSNPLLIVDQKLGRSLRCTSDLLEADSLIIISRPFSYSFNIDENHEIFEKKVREYFEEKVKRNGIHKVCIVFIHLRYI